MKKSTVFFFVYFFSFWLYLDSVPLRKNIPPDNRDTGRSEKLFQNIEKNQIKHLAFLRSMIQAQKDGEAAVQAIVAARFEDLGGSVETLKVLPASLDFKHQFAAKESIPAQKRISVVGYYPGSGNGRSLLLFAHPDGPDIKGIEEWVHDPFAGEIENNRIYGWGVADDLAGVAIMAEAMAAIADAGIKLKGDITLCSTPAKKNAQGVIALLNKGYKADASLYLHPAESGVGMREIKAIASGLLTFRIRVLGRPPDTTEPGKTAFAHLGINPINKAVLLLQALNRLDRNRSQRVRHPALDKRIGRSTNLLTGFINSGRPGRETQMPEECYIGVSLTFPPGEKLLKVQQEIKDCVSAAANSDPWLNRHPPELEWIFGTQGVEVPVDSPLYVVVSRVIQAVTGKEPYVNPLHSASDIRNPILYSGIPTLGFGPLSGDLAQNGHHDEWVDVPDYIRAIKITARSIVDWCQGTLDLP